MDPGIVILSVALSNSYLPPQTKMLAVLLAVPHSK